MTDHVFDVLSNIGAAAYCAPIALDEIMRIHPERVQACKRLSSELISDLLEALTAEMMDLYTVRDYLKMLCAMEDYRSMYLYIVLCFVSVDETIPAPYLAYGQNPEMLILLMKQMLRDIDEYIDGLNRLKVSSDE